MMWKGYPHCCCHGSDVLFLVDSSGSMIGDTGTRLEFAADLVTCYRRRMGSDCRYGLADIEYVLTREELEQADEEERERERWELRTPFTADKPTFLSAVDEMRADPAGGGIERYFHALKRMAQEWEDLLGGRPPGEAKRFIVLIGDEHGNDLDELPDVKQDLDAAGITAFGVAVAGAFASDEMEGATCRIVKRGSCSAEKVCRLLRFWMCPKILKDEEEQ